MPFIALNKETNERIDITQVEQPRLIKADVCVCQLCGSPMFVKAGMRNRAHFAHAHICDSPFESHPESADHRAGKIFLKENLPKEYLDYREAHIEYEVPIKEVMRVADVLATFPNGYRVAHEVQLASITSEVLQERTEDYARAGLDVIWWLGRNANTPANRDWCLRTFGYYCYLTEYLRG